jgi:hypothetical protein
MRLITLRPTWLQALGIAVIWLAGTPAIAGSFLDEQLERTGRAVDAFWQQVASVACTEHVTQEKISRKDKTEFKSDSTYDYLAFARTLENGFSVEELRVPKKRSANKRDSPSLLATNGFPTLLLVFHPHYQRSYQYYMEAGSSETDSLIRVHFEPIAGGQSTCALALKDRIYPLPLRGTAWIDRETGSIQKIVAGLVAPLKDINILAFNIEVVYKLQSFSSIADSSWLPESATVDVRTALQRWRNIHDFSGYKRFSVVSLESQLR